MINLNNELDMLRGNINRMVVTHDYNELIAMRDWAKCRIDLIFNFRESELDKEGASLK
jgi:hypothetical protein